MLLLLSGSERKGDTRESSFLFEYHDNAALLRRQAGQHAVPRARPHRSSRICIQAPWGCVSAH